MERPDKLKKFFSERYELTLRNESTYRTFLHKRVGIWHITFFFLLFLFLMSFLSYILIVKVSWIRNVLPGLEYVDTRKRQAAMNNKLIALQKQISEQDSLISLLQKTLDLSLGSSPTQSEEIARLLNTTSVPTSLPASKELSGELNSKFHSERSHSSKRFVLPVQGILIRKWDYGGGHFGIDFAAREGSSVLSIAEGHVIFSEYSLETGYTIIVQHKNHFVSVYKHNQKLLKTVGEFVQQGESIALVGGSGEYSTGPHLHFELWFRGIPVNPEWIWEFK